MFHGFADYNGISKKIFYQRDALIRCGADLRLCYLTIDAAGMQKRMLDDEVLENYGNGIAAKFKKRLCYGALTRYIREQGIEFLYVRYDHNANPALIRWFRQLKKIGVKIVVEIPTYPYDEEYARSRFSRKLHLFIDRCFRRSLAKYIDRIVTFTDYPEIFGVPTICISNGIDFSQIKVKPGKNDTSRELNLIGVAQIHFWHAFDRVIEGLAAYKSVPHEKKVRFHIVGEGLPADLSLLKELVKKYGLGEEVIFYGTRFGDGLDEVFDQCDMGIASLGRHRNRITKIKTLKNREYAARGIPFVYSETDDDFDAMPYVLKAPADDSPLDIAELVRFYDNLAMSPQEIRGTVEKTLSWDVQMGKVLDVIGR